MSVDSFTLLHNFQWSNYIRIGKYTWNLCQPPPPIPLPYPSTQFLLLFFRRENGTSKTKIGQSLQNRQGVKTACSLNFSGTKITTVSISYGTSGLSNASTSVKVDSNGNLKPCGFFKAREFLLRVYDPRWLHSFQIGQKIFKSYLSYCDRTSSFSGFLTIA